MKTFTTILLILSLGYANDVSLDKQTHFIASSSCYFFFRNENYSVEESAKYTLFIGFGKEISDALNNKSFSINDIKFNVLGIISSMILEEIYKPKKFL